MKSAIYINGVKLESDYPEFNGGERNVRLDTVEHIIDGYGDSIVAAYLYDSSSIIDLLFVFDAFQRTGVKVKTLIIPYLPYARQDRVCNDGEAFGLKVFANLVNQLDVKNIFISDPHSDVGPALIDKSSSQKQSCYVKSALNRDVFVKPDVLISPDGGALKKIYDVAKHIGVNEVVEASKIRNTSNGDITGVGFPENADIEGKNCWVVDDICDGGNSFNYLADKILEDNNPGHLGLYVTHGLFANGTKELYKRYDTVVSNRIDQNGAFIPYVVPDMTFEELEEFLKEENND